MEWFEFTQQYFLHRDTLAHVLLLVDAGVSTQPSDLECANWLGEAQASRPSKLYYLIHHPQAVLGSSTAGPTSDQIGQQQEVWLLFCICMRPCQECMLSHQACAHRGLPISSSYHNSKRALSLHFWSTPLL